MPQLVFLHGPGAGACADAFHYQVKHFPDSVAPTWPGHLEGVPCPDVARYMEWVRGWLWTQGRKGELVLVGYTLGASIALHYGLDYPNEVKGLVLMTVAARPKTRAAGAYEMRLRAAKDPKASEAAAAARHGRSHQSAGVREGDPRRRARFAVREARRSRALSAHRDARPGQRADRGIRGGAVRRAGEDAC
jgi:pimeloyl-ACP methyl ester carboxylesterase